MAQSLRKIFDLGIAAAVAVIIMNFAASSLGLGIAEAQEGDNKTAVTFAQSATFEVAALDH